MDVGSQNKRKANKNGNLKSGHPKNRQVPISKRRGTFKKKGNLKDGRRIAGPKVKGQFLKVTSNVASSWTQNVG